MFLSFCYSFPKRSTQVAVEKTLVDSIISLHPVHLVGCAGDSPYVSVYVSHSALLDNPNDPPWYGVQYLSYSIAVGALYGADSIVA
jgi:hypothetical protein